MELDDYVHGVQEQLLATAALGDDRVQGVAATLATAAAPAVRLAIMRALSDAADELTAVLLDSPGAPAVAIRLDGDTVRTEVTANDSEPSDVRVDDGEATARISLRLPDSLKSSIGAASAREGVSVNTWLVRAAAAALSSTGRSGRVSDAVRGNTGRRVTGYLNS